MSRILAILAFLAAFLLSPRPGPAQTFPIFAGDPIDPADGRPYEILPGVPLLLPQANGKYRPPIPDTSRIGDIDIVVRAGTPMIGPSIPGPVGSPPTGVAGGTRIASGTEIPFTVAASDGSTAAPYGFPLLGPQMNGIPVIVVAFADLDGDGIVGPTNADGDPDDNVREMQESDFMVGRQVAFFQNGVAQGSIAVWRGAPASEGGMKVVLTAVAFVGPYSPSYYNGFVPDGPGVTTLQPFFPRFNPAKRITGTDKPPALPSPTIRLGFEFEDEFTPPVDDPVLGTPFAIPTDGSSPTVDRAVVVSGPVAAMRFVVPSDPATFPLDGPQRPLARGAGGVLYEPLTSIALSDDGPGNAAHVRLVATDALDNIADAAGAAATLIAGPGRAITSPDTDGDPSRETVSVAGAAGVDVVLDDAGGRSGLASSSSLTVVSGGYPTDVLAVQLLANGPPPAPPTIALAEIVGNPTEIVEGCPSLRTLRAVVSDPDDDATGVTVVLTVDGVPNGSVELQPTAPPPGVALPPGRVFTGPLPPYGGTGTLALTFTARDATGFTSVPVAITSMLVTAAAPEVGAVAVAPTTLPSSGSQVVVITAEVVDDCSAPRLWAELDTGNGFRPIARLRDDGHRSDAVAKDGVFTGRRRLAMRTPGTYALRVTARNRMRMTTTSAVVPITVAP